MDIAGLVKSPSDSQNENAFAKCKSLSYVSGSREGNRLADPLASVFVEPVTIRSATPDDLGWLIDQTKAFAEFNKTKFLSFPNEEYARAKLLEMMERHFMRLAVRGDERLGFIAAWWVQHPYNPDVILMSETFWWVAEEHRHGRAGIMLLDEFVAFSKGRAHCATFSLLENSPVNERVLLKRGFRKHETAYILELD